MEEPDMEPDQAEAIAAALEEAYKFVRASERLNGILIATGRLSDDLSALHDLDPDLAPEITAALEGLKATLGAVGRAGDFLEARRQTVSARIA